MTSKKSLPLTDYGFSRMRQCASNKRTWQMASKDEIEDSQFDAHFQPFTPTKKIRHSRVPADSARNRSSTRSNDAQLAFSSDDIPTSPLGAQNMNTPRLSRFIEHDVSHPDSSPEVPSSLAFERYHHQSWLTETPTKGKPLNYARAGDLFSPPASSPDMPLMNDKQSSHQDNIDRRKQWLHTPVGIRTNPFTPPPSQRGQVTSLDPAADAQDLIDDMDDGRESRGKVSVRRRIPLKELNPSFVLSPAGRRVLPIHDQSAEPQQRTTSNGREDSPNEWFDALESLSPQVTTRALHIHVDEPLTDIQETPKLVKTSTVQDSQWDETLDVLLNDTIDTAAQPSQDYREDDLQSYSWQDNSSLLNTLLPPGYRSSQYDPSTQAHDASSDGPVMSPSTFRIKRRLTSTADYEEITNHENKTRKLDHSNPDGLPPSSWEQDNSLLYTMLQPPPFSMSSTAD